MQKKLLSAAIGAALTSASFMAQADVTVYGAAQVEWVQLTNDALVYSYGGFTSAGGGSVGSWNNTNTVPANTTRSGLLDNKRGRFGIKADEDLGGGWKGVVNFEWQVDTADGADGTPISERISYVGISQKSIGTLRFGQDHSPYKASGTALDPFVTTTLEARNNYGMSGNRDNWSVMNGHNSFVQDGMFFNSASWAGVYVNAYIGLDRTGAEGTCAPTSGAFIYFGNCDAAAANGKTNGDLSAVVGWKGDAGPIGLHFFGGYNKMANTTSIDEPTAMKAAGQLIIAKAHTISLQYELTDRANRTADDYDEGQYLFLGYQGKFGPVTAVVQLGQFESGTEAGAGGRNITAEYLALGAIYNMSKTFRLFGGWRNTVATVDPASVDFRDDSVISLGMRKDF